MFRCNNTHPVIRQFILRSAVLNYLGKCLQQQWDDWSKLSTPSIQRILRAERRDGDEVEEEEHHEARQMLAQLIESLRSKVEFTHRLLQREYNELFAYMMDKSALWDSPEYFKAKTALGTATNNLRTCTPNK